MSEERWYTYRMPTEIAYGFGIVELLGKKAKDFAARRIFVVTDPGVVKAGIVDQALDTLPPELEVTVFDKVVPNSSLEVVEEGTALAKETKPDMLLGIGGGSSLDTAKVIGLLLYNPGSYPDYQGLDKSKNPREIPFIAIPTTAGTGSEITRWACINDNQRKQKVCMGDWKIAADLALVDPGLTISMPRSLTAATGIDALSHSLEAYVSNNASPFTDPLSARSIQLVGKYLRRAVADGEDREARDGMMQASLIAAMAFPSSGCGMVHGMGMPCSGFYGTGHGVTMGIFMPPLMEYNLSARPVKFAEIATLLGEDVSDLTPLEGAKRAAEAVRQLAKDVGIPSLKETGFKLEDIPALTERAMENSLDMQTNPKPMTYDDIVAVYEKIYAEG